MATMNISLPDQMREWIDGQLDAGKYASSSDYVRDLIRNHQEQCARIEMIQSEIKDGFASGEPRTFDVTDFKREMKSKYCEGTV